MTKTSTNSDLPIAVVGAGAGGLPAATALVETGHKVVLLDGGMQFSGSEFNTRLYDYETKSSPWVDNADEWNGPVKVQGGKGVGGSTLFFQAVSLLPPEDTLAKWGISVQQFKSIAAQVVEFLRIAGESQPAHSLNKVSAYIFHRTKEFGWRVRKAPVAILSRAYAGRPSCNYCGLCVYGCRPGDKSSADRTWLPRGRWKPLFYS